MDYNTILKGKYPAKAHARRVVDYIRSKVPDATGVLYLESRMTKLLEDNDEPEHFRQRRFFYYLSGVPLADSYLIHEISTSKTTLFIPPIDPESVIWSGLPVSADEAKASYDVDDVKYTTDLNATLARVGQSSKDNTVFAIPEQVSDHVTFLEFDNKNFSVLKEAIEVCRVVKDEHELALIAKANAVSHDAHLAVMQAVKHKKTESELYAVFLANSVSAGAENQAYHGIFAAGRAAATLHYVKNDAPLEGKLNVLLDAGAEWNCYASDITRTFPISGKFSKESRAIYDIVLRMQEECIDMLKEGVVWDDVHLHAHKVAIDGLLELGLLKGDKEDILKKRTSVAFFPHGLGHYLGMDTHDTGGNANYADKDSMFRYLRVRGTLPAGSVITVEPGIYFCNFIIEPFLKDPEHSKYIDADVLEKYWDVGGVRIEDNVVVTKTGSQNLTTVVRDADEIERIISSS
ncbi:peptidase M24, structural domain-containing protein [Coniochaeta sp. 2T2.1]|nr:peptidase M24, structural domain-containing protein [Coniochaeta sp. 2T2.1]